MRLRWSNNRNASIEFDCSRPDGMAAAMSDAYIEYMTRSAGASRDWQGRTTDRVELHVNVGPDRWYLPLFPSPHGREDCPSGPGEYGLPIGNTHVGTHVIVFDGGLAGGEKADIVHKGYHDEPVPSLCGRYWSDYALCVGPGHWHAEAVYDACLKTVKNDHDILSLSGEIASHATENRAAREVKCLRCGHTWTPRIERPRVCPKCKNPNWDTPRTGSEPGPKPRDRE